MPASTDDLEKEAYARAKDKALGRLSRKETSVLELQRYLKGKKFDAEIVDSVIQELKQNNWIDDLRFARMYIRYQEGRGKGPRYIALKLREKGVSLSLKEIEDILLEVAARSQEQTAMSLVERKYPRAFEDRRELSRAYQGLLRRGFALDLVKKVLFSRDLKVED